MSLLTAIGLDVTPGECAFCGARLRVGGPGRRGEICAGAECRREYQRLYHRRRRGSAPRVRWFSVTPLTDRVVLVKLECGHVTVVSVRRKGQSHSLCVVCRVLPAQGGV